MLNQGNSYAFCTSAINTIQPYFQFAMGHCNSPESSKIDLLFVGGQVRSEADLVMLNFFCECEKYGTCNQSCIIVFFFFQLNQKYFYDLVVLIELSTNSEIRRDWGGLVMVQKIGLRV